MSNTDMSNLIFDIETGPLPDAELEARMPEFKPAANLKDPLKIKLDVEDKKLAWKEGAALSAMTGKVIAIGYALNDQPVVILGEAAEKDTIQKFWEVVFEHRGGRLIGFNSNSFDLPFLFQRSWVHRLTPPEHLRRGRYWSDGVVDLRDTWNLYTYGAKGSLNDISMLLEIGKKTGNGADFARLWTEDREKAVEYLKTDVGITRKLGLLIDPRCAEY